MLPGSEGGLLPFWSPDSHSIGFFVGGKLKRIDTDGKLLQTLCDAQDARGGAWSPNGTILFASDRYSALYQIPASGGTPRQVTEINASRDEQSHRWPFFLADGRHFLFFIRSEQQPEVTGIYAGSLDSKDYHPVVKATLGPAFEAGGTILYVRDDVVVAQPFDERKLATAGEPVALPDHVGGNPAFSRASFSVSRTGVLLYSPAPPGGPFVLAWYDRDGKRSDPLDTGYFYHPSLSPDGTQAVVPIVSSDGLSVDLWSFDLGRGTKTRLTSGPGYKLDAVWQPDGRFLLFDSASKDWPHIYRIKSGGMGMPEPVLESNGVTEAPWSICRDGRYLAYVRSTKDSQPAVWILPLTGDRKPFALVQSQFMHLEPAFSPDCKWVVYTSNETGQGEVYITHFPDAARRYRVSTQGGFAPHWRGDGKELFYFSFSQNSVMAVNVDEKAEEISLGPPRALFRLATQVIAAATGRAFDVTADGRRFLIVEANSPHSTVPLTLVTNWDAELKKR